MDKQSTEEQYEALSGPRQKECFFIGGFLILCLILASGVLVYFVKFHWPVFCSLSTENIQDSLYVFQISILGGGFGGALRGLMMLITETGGPIKGRPVSENPDWYLSRWTHYGVKPFIGAGIGLLFFCAVNFGAVRVLTGSSDLKHLKPLPIFFVSAIGGLFFEEVKEILWNLLGTFSARKDTAQKKSGQNDGK